ncbi:MAG: SLC13 family permease [Lysobacterales bacterium]
MGFEAILVLVVVAAAIVAFATERFPVEGVALSALIVLLVGGVLEPQQGFAGFANEAVITVAAMFALSEGLQRSGALSTLARWMVRYGTTPTRLLLMVVVVSGFVSAFVNNTAAVAVFIPLVLAAANANQLSPSKLLIPLSYASQLGGVCTLLGTSTNLLVASVAVSAGVGQLGVFAPTPYGLIVFAFGAIYLLVLSPWLLPARRGADLTENYSLGDYISELAVTSGSALVGKRIRMQEWESEYGIRVLEVIRDENKLFSPLDVTVRADDILLVNGELADLMSFRERFGLIIAPQFALNDKQLTGDNIHLVEALIAPGSRFAGETLDSLNFHAQHHAVVLAIRRRGETLRDKLKDVELSYGDALLVLVERDHLGSLRSSPELIVLERGERLRSPRRARIALAIMLGVVGLAAFKVLPIVLTALLGVMAMIFTRCMRADEAYQAVDWRVILLLACMIPLGTAMQDTGLARWIADNVIGQVSPLGALATLSAIYLLTAVLTEFMSNNAAAVLMAPIAISTARTVDSDPLPFLLAVMFAASTAFSTPLGYQTNTMVYNTGGYRFRDFVTIGLPLNVALWILATVCIPLIWPL